MEAAVTTLLADSSAYSVGRVWRPANCAGLQTEPEDRFSGRRRSPQQPESLAVAGGKPRRTNAVKGSKPSSLQIFKNKSNLNVRSLG